jgi:molybdopterin/thiamine biosynthesis adenylyltransferase
MDILSESVKESSLEGDEEARYRPQQFHLSKADDRCAMQELLRIASGIRVHDTLLTQMRDLVRTRNPNRKLTAAELDCLTREHLGDGSPDEYGIWFYYPWSNRLVHLLEESEFVELRTNRNCYKITPEEQARLSHKRVGIVGLSVGHAAALTIALERSCGEIRLADFDTLDLSNLNRIRTGVHNLGIPKTYLTAREIAEADPFLPVKVLPEGITPDNIDQFLLEGGRLDVVVEECDSLDIKIRIRHEARRRGIPVVTDTSDRGMLDIERFDHEPSRPIFHGLANGLDPEQMRGLTAEEKIPYIVALLELDRVSLRLRASMIEVEQTITTWPQLASAVTMGGGAAADAVRRICLGEAVLSGRYYLEMDQLVSVKKAEEQENSGSQVRSPDLTKKQMLEAVHPLARQTSTSNHYPGAELVRRIIADAIAAPSGGNSQPWKWLYHNGQIYAFLDRTRSRIPYDPQGLGSVLAIGCAAENLILSAHNAGLKTCCDVHPNADAPELIARFTFHRCDNADAERVWRPKLYQFIATRRTNRKPGNRQPLPAEDKAALSEAARSVAGSEIHWLEGESQLQECAESVALCDLLQLTSQPLHEFVMSEIRWTPEELRATRDGIGLENLELSPSDKAGFELCRDWSALEFVREVGSGGNLTKFSRKAIVSASAVGLITAPAQTVDANFSAGRAIERMWLTATERSLALHPMTALPYILAAAEKRSWLGADDRTRAFCDRLRPRYRELFPTPADPVHVFLFRVSRAEQTTVRSLRRSVEDVLTITSGEGETN